MGITKSYLYLPLSLRKAGTQLLPAGAANWAKQALDCRNQEASKKRGQNATNRPGELCLKDANSQGIRPVEHLKMK